MRRFLLLATALLLGVALPAQAQLTPAQEWANISLGSCDATTCHAGTRRVFNLGIGSLFSFSSRQFTSSGKSLDPSNVAVPSTPVTPQLVGGIKREFTYCWRYIAASARACTTTEIAEGSCETLGAFFEVLPEEWLSLREREENYELLPVTPKSPLSPGLPPDAFYFAWGDSSRIDPSTGALLEKPACPVTSTNEEAQPPFVSQTYWDFIIGGMLAWDGQLLDARRYEWDLDAESSHSEEWMRRHVAVFPSYSYEERRRLAVEIVRTTAKTTPAGAEWLDDRSCPFTGNAIMTLQSDLRYPQATMDTITGPAIGTVSPVSNSAFRALVDDILSEGGWAVSERKSVDCATASGNVPRDEWVRNPFWDDIQRWRTANVLEPAEMEATWRQHDEDTWRPILIVLIVVGVLEILLFVLLLALLSHVCRRTRLNTATVKKESPQEGQVSSQAEVV